MNWPTYASDSWDPFMGLRDLQQEMNRLFEGYAPGGAAAGYPALNVWSNKDAAVVTAEVPGVSPEELDIKVVKNLLTLQGERKADGLAEGVVCHRSERPVGKFTRTLRLPFEVENDKVTAKCDRGMLTITLPRAEATKPKRVEITAA